MNDNQFEKDDLKDKDDSDIHEKQENKEGGVGTATLHTFEGKVEGTIITEKRGNEGFGYDPIFMPEGYDKTFAELGIDMKNIISHRAIAVRKLADYLMKN